MRIQLVIGDTDSRYLDNLQLYMERNHLDTLEVLSFTKPDIMQGFLENQQADVILLGENFGIDASQIAESGVVAYLAENERDCKRNDAPVIARYKKPELIYKDVLNLYANGGGKWMQDSDGSSASGRLIMVTSFSGGTGASTIAAAIASYFASKKEKSIYLNFEPTGSSSVFFAGEGNYHFEDVLYAVKGSGVDTNLKITASIRTDRSGVDYFAESSKALYNLEMTADDITAILDAIRKCGEYQRIIIDMGFSLEEDVLKICSLMDSIIVVNDGTMTANAKYKRTLAAMEVLERQKKTTVRRKMRLLYNRFSNKSSEEIDNPGMPVLGELPPIRHAKSTEVLKYLLDNKKDVFDKLV